MTPKNKKIAIGVSATVMVLGIGYLAYRRSVNKKNSALLLEYISTLPIENTVGAQNAIANQNVDTAMAETQTTNLSNALSQYKYKLVALDGKWYNLTISSQKTIATDKAISIAKGLNEAMKGTFTDKVKFEYNFKRIGSYGAFIFINAIYTSMYKEDLWTAINGESDLYHGSHSNAVKYLSLGLVDFPNYDSIISTQAKIWNIVEQKMKTVNKK